MVIYRRKSVIYCKVKEVIARFSARKTECTSLRERLSILRCGRLKSFWKECCWLLLDNGIVVTAFILAGLRRLRSYVSPNICLCRGCVSWMLKSSVIQSFRFFLYLGGGGGGGTGDGGTAFLAEFSWVIDAVGVLHFHAISVTSWGKREGQRLRRQSLFRSFCLVFIDAFHSTFQ